MAPRPGRLMPLEPPAGWSVRPLGEDGADGVVLCFDDWPGTQQPWLCRVRCPDAPDPAASDDWVSWVGAQVQRAAQAGDGLVVAIEVDQPGTCDAVIAVDGVDGGTTIVARWVGSSEPAGTMVAAAGVADGDWPSLRPVLPPILDALARMTATSGPVQA